jgi:hypothetical protein
MKFETMQADEEEEVKGGGSKVPEEESELVDECDDSSIDQSLLGDEDQEIEETLVGSRRTATQSGLGTAD